MKSLRTILLAALAVAFTGPAFAQVGTTIAPDARGTPLGPARISTSEGFNVSAGAQTVAADIIDVRPSDAFVIEGPVRMAIDGIVVFVVDCAVYSGDRIVARFNRGAPMGAGPFEGRFRFGLARTAEGVPTSYGCWANAYGTRNGANWRAYEEPNASVAGGMVQLIKYGDGRFWDGGAISQQVVLHFSGALGNVAQPVEPAGLTRGPRIPDGSDVQWRPPIIPPLVANVLNNAGSGAAAGDWASTQDLFQVHDISASDFLRNGVQAPANPPAAQPTQRVAQPQRY